MADAAFLSALIHEVAIKRPVAGSTGDLNLQSAQYADVYATRKRCRIMPAGGSTDPGLLGRFPDATHLMYCERLDVKPNYLIELELAQTTLSRAVQAGATQLPVAETTGLDVGSIIEVSDGANADQAQVTLVDSGVLHISPALSHAFTAGSAVRCGRCFDVLHVADEAGARHHLKVIMREREV
jgi:hypothetical protein